MRGIKGLGTLIVAGAILAVTTACGTPDSSATDTSAAASASSPSASSQPTRTSAQGSAAAATAGSEPASPITPSPITPVPLATAGGSAPESAAPEVVVPDELQFTATTLDGAAFSGASLAGSPAVLWFWAPWCPNCRAEAPQVATAAAATKGQVTFIGVAAQDDLAPMQAFVDNYGVGGFEHLADLDAAIWQRFGVTYQPAYAFIGADGAVDVVKSRMSESELADKLAELAAS